MLILRRSQVSFMSASVSGVGVCWSYTFLGLQVPWIFFGGSRLFNPSAVASMTFAHAIFSASS